MSLYVTIRINSATLETYYAHCLSIENGVGVYEIGKYDKDGKRKPPVCTITHKRDLGASELAWRTVKEVMWKEGVTTTMADKIQKEIRTPADFTSYVVKCAKEWIPGSISDINRNHHMNDCNGAIENNKFNQDLVDAAITAFINHIGASFCMDYGFYTNDLRYKMKPLGSYKFGEDPWIREGR